MSQNETHKGENVLRFDPNKPLQVGGQAVIEGVMMRAPGRIATAVRRAGGEIVVKWKNYTSLSEKHGFFKLPIVRGAVGLVEMMFIGIETLNFSAEVAMHDIEQKEKPPGNGAPPKPVKKKSNWKIALTVVFSLTVGIAIFFLTPLVVATQFFTVDQDAFAFNLVAGVIRIALLLAYLSAISLMKDVKRLFRYHGAEHKAVFTFESGGELTPGSAMGYTRFHPRCGTSFILIVMVSSILLFAILDSFLIGVLGTITLPVRLVTHIPFIPLVGGVAYEFIRWSARRSTTPLGKALVAPGLWLQRITTREPEDGMLEVAIVALTCALGAAPPHGIRVIEHISELVPAIPAEHV
ncbi:MAG TPA: DUF1385 domain-containing protein [Bacteroidota bacterium]|nr:DUF1385 domain-containing protein [Bacteroidota bacterium]